MKRISGLLLLTMVLTLFLPLVSCGLFEPQWFGWNGEFKVTIEDVTGFGSVDFEVSKSYRVCVELSEGRDVNDETYKDIQIEYNEENVAVYYSNCSKTKSSVFFYIYAYELGQKDELAISYNGKTTKVNYNVVDFDFEANKYITVDSVDDLDRFPEFKEMLLSIDYYEFAEPYVGIDKFDVRTKNNGYGEQVKYWISYIDENEENPDYVSTDYLKYLKDSVYYPAKFSSVPENPISNIDFIMEMPMSANLDKGTGREEMISFSIGYSAIDPCCTNPQNPIRSMSFYASDRENLMTYKRKNLDGIYPSQLSIFFEKYPERFFVYDLNGITVYIICTNAGASAYFEDGTYFYRLYAGYEK